MHNLGFKMLNLRMSQKIPLTVYLINSPLYTSVQAVFSHWDIIYSALNIFSQHSPANISWEKNIHTAEKHQEAMNS